MKKSFLNMGALILCIAQFGMAAPAASKKVIVAECKLTAEQGAGLFHRFGEKVDARFDHVDLTVTQRIATSKIPVSPDFEIAAVARDKAGASLTNDNSSQRHLDRLVVHTADDVLAIAYDPATNSTSTTGFLLSIRPEESYLNYTKRPVNGVTYQVPTAVNCTLVDPVMYLSTKESIDLSKLSPIELKRLVDTYIRRKSADYSLRRVFDLKKETELAFTKQIMAEVEKAYPGKTCKELETVAAYRAVDHTGNAFGYRIRVVCPSIQRELITKTDPKLGEFVRTWDQGLTLYYDANRKGLPGMTRYERANYGRWRKPGDKK